MVPPLDTLANSKNIRLTQAPHDNREEGHGQCQRRGIEWTAAYSGRCCRGWGHAYGRQRAPPRGKLEYQRGHVAGEPEEVRGEGRRATDSPAPGRRKKLETTINSVSARGGLN